MDRREGETNDLGEGLEWGSLPPVEHEQLIFSEKKEGSVWQVRRGGGGTLGPSLWLTSVSSAASQFVLSEHGRSR